MNPQLKDVVIADDHPLMLKGLKLSLIEAGYQVVAAVTTGTEALAALEKYQPCLGVLDISMPGLDGLEVATIARANNWRTAIVLLSIYDDPAYIFKAKRIPVAGYISKENAGQDIIRALEQILAGEPYFDHEIENAYHLKVLPTVKKISALRPSEQKILRAVGKGKNVKQIAESFFISTRTVEKHRENIRRKLDIDLTKYPSLDVWAQEHAALLQSSAGPDAK